MSKRKYSELQAFASDAGFIDNSEIFTLKSLDYIGGKHSLVGWYKADRAVVRSRTSSFKASEKEKYVYALLDNSWWSSKSAKEKNENKFNSLVLATSPKYVNAQEEIKISPTKKASKEKSIEGKKSTLKTYEEKSSKTTTEEAKEESLKYEIKGLEEEVAAIGTTSFLFNLPQQIISDPLLNNQSTVEFLFSPIEESNKENNAMMHLSQFLLNKISFTEKSEAEGGKAGFTVAMVVSIGSPSEEEDAVENRLLPATTESDLLHRHASNLFYLGQDQYSQENEKELGEWETALGQEETATVGEPLVHSIIAGRKKDVNTIKTALENESRTRGGEVLYMEYEGLTKTGSNTITELKVASGFTPTGKSAEYFGLAGKYIINAHVLNIFGFEDPIIFEPNTTIKEVIGGTSIVLSKDAIHTGKVRFAIENNNNRSEYSLSFYNANQSEEAVEEGESTEKEEESEGENETIPKLSLGGQQRGPSIVRVPSEYAIEHKEAFSWGGNEIGPTEPIRPEVSYSSEPLKVGQHIIILNYDGVSVSMTIDGEIIFFKRTTKHPILAQEQQIKSIAGKFTKEVEILRKEQEKGEIPALIAEETTSEEEENYYENTSKAEASVAWIKYLELNLGKIANQTHKLKLAELAVFDRSLSSNEIHLINKHWAAHYGLPYKSAAAPALDARPQRIEVMPAWSASEYQNLGVNVSPWSEKNIKIVKEMGASSIRFTAPWNGMEAFKGEIKKETVSPLRPPKLTWPDRFYKHSIWGEFITASALTAFLAPREASISTLKSEIETEERAYVKKEEELYNKYRESKLTEGERTALKEGVLKASKKAYEKQIELENISSELKEFEESGGRTPIEIVEKLKLCTEFKIIPRIIAEINPPFRKLYSAKVAGSSLKAELIKPTSASEFKSAGINPTAFAKEYNKRSVVTVPVSWSLKEFEEIAESVAESKIYLVCRLGTTQIHFADRYTNAGDYVERINPIFKKETIGGESVESVESIEAVEFIIGGEPTKGKVYTPESLGSYTINLNEYAYPSGNEDNPADYSIEAYARYLNYLGSFAYEAMCKINEETTGKYELPVREILIETGNEPPKDSNAWQTRKIHWGVAAERDAGALTSAEREIFEKEITTNYNKTINTYYYFREESKKAIEIAKLTRQKNILKAKKESTVAKEAEVKAASEALTTLTNERLKEEEGPEKYGPHKTTEWATFHTDLSAMLTSPQTLFELEKVSSEEKTTYHIHTRPSLVRYVNGGASDDGAHTLTSAGFHTTAGIFGSPNSFTSNYAQYIEAVSKKEFPFIADSLHPYDTSPEQRGSYYTFQMLAPPAINGINQIFKNVLHKMNYQPVIGEKEGKKEYGLSQRQKYENYRELEKPDIKAEITESNGGGTVTISKTLKTGGSTFKAKYRKNKVGEKPLTTLEERTLKAVTTLGAPTSPGKPEFAKTKLETEEISELQNGLLPKIVYGYPCTNKVLKPLVKGEPGAYIGAFNEGALRKALEEIEKNSVSETTIPTPIVAQLEVRPEGKPNPEELPSKLKKYYWEIRISQQNPLLNKYIETPVKYGSIKKPEEIDVEGFIYYQKETAFSCGETPLFLQDPIGERQHTRYLLRAWLFYMANGASRYEIYTMFEPTSTGSIVSTYGPTIKASAHNGDILTNVTGIDYFQNSDQSTTLEPTGMQPGKTVASLPRGYRGEPFGGTIEAIESQPEVITANITAKSKVVELTGSAERVSVGSIVYNKKYEAEHSPSIEPYSYVVSSGPIGFELSKPALKTMKNISLEIRSKNIKLSNPIQFLPYSSTFPIFVEVTSETNTGYEALIKSINNSYSGSPIKEAEISVPGYSSILGPGVPANSYVESEVNVRNSFKAEVKLVGAETVLVVKEYEGKTEKAGLEAFITFLQKYYNKDEFTSLVNKTLIPAKSKVSVKTNFKPKTLEIVLSTVKAEKAISSEEFLVETKIVAAAGKILSSKPVEWKKGAILQIIPAETVGQNELEFKTENTYLRDMYFKIQSFIKLLEKYSKMASALTYEDLPYVQAYNTREFKVEGTVEAESSVGELHSSGRISKISIPSNTAIFGKISAGEIVEVASNNPSEKLIETTEGGHTSITNFKSTVSGTTQNIEPATEYAVELNSPIEWESVASTISDFAILARSKSNFPMSVIPIFGENKILILVAYIRTDAKEFEGYKPWPNGSVMAFFKIAPKSEILRVEDLVEPEKFYTESSEFEGSVPVSVGGANYRINVDNWGNTLNYLHGLSREKLEKWRVFDPYGNPQDQKHTNRIIAPEENGVFIKEINESDKYIELTKPTINTSEAIAKIGFKIQRSFYEPITNTPLNSEGVFGMPVTDNPTMAILKINSIIKLSGKIENAFRKIIILEGSNVEEVKKNLERIGTGAKIVNVGHSILPPETEIIGFKLNENKIELNNSATISSNTGLVQFEAEKL